MPVKSHKYLAPGFIAKLPGYAAQAKKEPESNGQAKPIGKLFEVGYIAAFEDGRRDLFDRFTLAEQHTHPQEIFRCLLQLEPAIREAGYIWVNLKLPQQTNIVSTVEFQKDEIVLLIKKLIRPGIIRH